MLRRAEEQIRDWKEWTNDNDGYARQCFAKILRRRKPAATAWAAEGVDAATEILDPRTLVFYHFHIVLGRSSQLRAEERQTRAAYEAGWGGPEIATYDRFLAIARRHDKANAALRQSRSQYAIASRTDR